MAIDENNRYPLKGRLPGAVSQIPRGGRAMMRAVMEELGGVDAIVAYAQRSDKNFGTVLKAYIATLPKSGTMQVSGNIGHLHIAAFQKVTASNALTVNDLATVQPLDTVKQLATGQPIDTEHNPYTASVRESPPLSPQDGGGVE